MVISVQRRIHELFDVPDVLKLTARTDPISRLPVKCAALLLQHGREQQEELKVR